MQMKLDKYSNENLSLLFSLNYTDLLIELWKNQFKANCIECSDNI